MEAETYVYELCRQAQIACSEVLLCDISKKWIDRDFMIVEYIPSIAMSQSGMTQEQKISLYVDAGKLAKQMHGIANHTFGRVSEILIGLSFSRWSEYLSSELEDILSRLIRDDGIEPEKAAGAQQIIVKYRDWLDEITTPRLVHTDLWEGNILLEENNKQQIAAIIDSDRALFGDPDYDLACPWMMNDAYLRGYGLEENSFHDEAFNSPKRTARRKIYLVLYRFLEAYVGLSEYNNQDLYENSLRDAFRIVEELMSE